ncbi:IDEAL domain-containing protein [Halalkalibacter alkalisediminis]|uniref:IDEAL domain-containing protein n=1 Tax=Halalkalibacter alkalisediminis TaxID=935616 RepID=A0ABV6NHV0_9BACI|nr:IDEAL domain-containing protein [Halalkalibacter alkalisediminis]
METYNKKGFKVGDWVIGKSYNGEIVHGYIEIIEPLNTIVKVFVIDSDNLRFKGRTIKLNEKTVEKQPIFSEYVEGELLNLIDLALSTRDEQWFFELTAKLLRKQQRLMIRKKD